jgi:hypothetical protein
VLIRPQGHQDGLRGGVCGLSGRQRTVDPGRLVRVSSMPVLAAVVAAVPCRQRHRRSRSSSQEAKPNKINSSYHIPQAFR